MTDVVLSWSGGKDAAWTLHALADRDVTIRELLTTVDPERDRTTMHGVRRALLARQAAALDLSVRFVELPAASSNETYESVVAGVLADYRDDGVDAVAYGDLHLEDIRRYREERHADAGVDGRWPIWGRDTTGVATEFLDAGFRAIAVAVDGDVLDPTFAGRAYDESFLEDLPEPVDPCGENGEFHTFVHDGPPFQRAIDVERGETVTRDVGDGVFHYCDLTLS